MGKEKKAISTGEAGLQGVAALKSLMERWDAGDNAAKKELRKLFDEQPECWQCLVNTASAVELLWISLLTKKDSPTEEVMKRELARMRTDLEGENPSPLIRLLAQRVTACWLQVQHADLAYGHAMSGSIALSVSEYHQRRVDRANSRFLSAVKTLAVVRRLGIPAVQVNIGEKQVNMVGPASQA